jgi:Transposase DDE domain
VTAWRAEPRITRGGQPAYSALAITTTLTLRAVFRLVLRQTAGLIGSILHLLGLDLAVPEHSTLSRRAEMLEMPPPQSGADVKSLYLLVDSTGLRLCGAGDWLLEKHGSHKRRSWRKLHLATDAGSGRILASVLTDHDVDDGAQVGPLLDQICSPVASLTAAGAFDRDDVYAAVAARPLRRERHRATTARPETADFAGFSSGLRLTGSSMTVSS